jgi:uncharacterized protein (DUF2267 family)
VGRKTGSRKRGLVCARSTGSRQQDRHRRRRVRITFPRERIPPLPKLFFYYTPTIMILDFEKLALKGTEFMHELQINLGNKDRAHASRILTSVFRVLRNHLSMSESLNLLAQLPVALKGVYADGWALHEHYRVKSLDDFLVEVLRQEGNKAWRDFANREEIIDAIRAVLDTLRLYASHDGIEEILDSMPEDIHKAFREPKLEGD